VLDACAAPGGKATALAEVLEEGVVHAVDVSPVKLGLVAEAARRLGLGNVDVHAGDATSPMRFAPPGGYDVALLDAPCSGLGVLRRHPEAKWRLRSESIGELAALQARLLENVGAHVRPGGILVYSVCTMTPEETDGVVTPFLDRHSGWEIVDTVPAGWQSLFDERGFFRVSPHRHHMDGFFAARLRKGRA
jgi:16S rRNA (cytosine967-C5)-methyltransferase